MCPWPAFQAMRTGMFCRPFACPSWSLPAPLVSAHVERHLQKSLLLKGRWEWWKGVCRLGDQGLPRSEVLHCCWLQPDAIAVEAVDRWQSCRSNYSVFALAVIRSEIEYARNSLPINNITRHKISAMFIQLTWSLAATERGSTRFAICNTSAISKVALRDKFDPVVSSSSMAVRAWKKGSTDGQDTMHRRYRHPTVQH